MATEKEVREAKARARADAAEGKYNNPTWDNPFDMIIGEAIDQEIREAYREGHADKKREMDKKK